MYVPSKESVGLDAERLAEARIVGIDPGKRELITGIAYEDNLHDYENGRRDIVIEVPARHYPNAAMLYLAYNKEQANRAKANIQTMNIQNVYEQMGEHPTTAPRMRQFKEYIATVRTTVTGP